MPDPLQVDERRWTIRQNLHHDLSAGGPQLGVTGATVEVVPASVVAARDREIKRLRDEAASLEARAQCVAEGRRYPDCNGDCGQHGVYCCDGAWDWQRRVAALTEEVQRLRRVEASIEGKTAFEVVAEKVDAEIKLHEAQAEVARLTARTHEIAADGDRRNADLESAVARYQARFNAARERTKDWRPDWTTDPPSQEAYGWWRYSSRNHVDEVALLIEECRAEGARQEREAKSEILRRLRDGLDDVAQNAPTQRLVLQAIDSAIRIVDLAIDSQPSGGPVLPNMQGEEPELQTPHTGVSSEEEPNA